jgi:DNA-binding transcriptional MocR family regulator
LVCRTFLDPGDVLICEGPTFPGALLPFVAAQARVVQVLCDTDGLTVGGTGSVLREVRTRYLSELIVAAPRWTSRPTT